LAGDASTGWRLLLSRPILLNFGLFLLITIIYSGMSLYLVAGLAALHGTSAVIANAALSVSLAVNGAAVLLGGWIAGRTNRHIPLSMVCFLGAALTMLAIAIYDLPPVLLIAALSGANFCMGLMMPSRDMIVRSVTPPGQFGKVFGFVTTGFNVGGVFAPMIFGAFLDHGQPAGVFLLTVACCVMGIFTVMTIRPRTA